MLVCNVKLDVGKKIKIQIEKLRPLLFVVVGRQDGESSGGCQDGETTSTTAYLNRLFVRLYSLPVPIVKQRRDTSLVALPIRETVFVPVYRRSWR